MSSASQRRPGRDVSMGSEEEDLPEIVLVPVLVSNPEAARTDVRRVENPALASAHVENDTLKTKVHALENKLAELDLAASKTKGTGKRGRKVNPANPPDPNDATSIARLAKFFWVFHNIQIPDEAFKAKPSITIDDERRFTPQYKLAGFTADLYACYPVEFHPNIASSLHFREIVVDEMKNGAANALTRVRGIAGDIFGVPQDRYKLPKKRKGPSTKTPQSESPILTPRSHHTKIQDLLGFDCNPETGKKVYRDRDYLIWPPVLYHPDHIGDFDFIFWSDYLLQLAVAVIYGPTYVDSLGDHSTLVFRSNGTYNHGDRDVETTPGLIASMAALAKYLNSDDTEFAASCKGNVTEINYADHFDEHLKFLVEGRGDERVEALFNHWNANLFPRLADLQESESATPNDTQGDNTGMPPVRAVDRMLASLRKNRNKSASPSPQPEAHSPSIHSTDDVADDSAESAGPSTVLENPVAPVSRPPTPASMHHSTVIAGSSSNPPSARLSTGQVSSSRFALGNIPSASRSSTPLSTPANPPIPGPTTHEEDSPAGNSQSLVPPPTQPRRASSRRNAGIPPETSPPIDTGEPGKVIRGGKSKRSRK